jgi:hypothetical protein
MACDLCFWSWTGHPLPRWKQGSVRLKDGTMLVFGGDAMGIPEGKEVRRHLYLNDMWGLKEGKHRTALLWSAVEAQGDTNGTDGASWPPAVNSGCLIGMFFMFLGHYIHMFPLHCRLPLSPLSKSDCVVCDTCTSPSLKLDAYRVGSLRARSVETPLYSTSF